MKIAIDFDSAFDLVHRNFVLATQKARYLSDRFSDHKAWQAFVSRLVRRDDRDDFKSLALFRPVPNWSSTDSLRVVTIEDVVHGAGPIDHERNRAFEVAQARTVKELFNFKCKTSPGDPRPSCYAERIIR